MKAFTWLSLVLVFVIASVSVMGLSFNANPLNMNDSVTTVQFSTLVVSPQANATYSVIAEDTNKVDCNVVSVTAPGDSLQLSPNVAYRGTATCTLNTSVGGVSDSGVLNIQVSRGERLAITNVDFTGSKDDSISTTDLVVGSSTETVVDGGSVSVRPGKTLTVKVEVKSLWPDNFDDNHQIRNAEVKAELNGIGSIDKEDETESVNDLSPGEDDKVTFTFDIPQLVGRDSGDLTLTFKGTDRDGTHYSGRVRLRVDVDKESHSLDLKSHVTPETLSCNRNGQFDVAVTNIGSNDEDVQLLLKNDQLNLKFFETFELKEAEDEEDSEAIYKQTYSFNVPSTLAPGTYPVKVSAFYQSERREATQTLNLVVQACDQSQSRVQTPSSGRDTGDNDQVPPRRTEPQPRQTVEVVQQPQVPTVGTQVVAQPVVANRASTQRESTTLTSGVVAMIVGAAVLLVLMVVLVVVLARRR